MAARRDDLLPAVDHHAEALAVVVFVVDLELLRVLVPADILEVLGLRVGLGPPRLSLDAVIGEILCALPDKIDCGRKFPRLIARENFGAA